MGWPIPDFPEYEPPPAMRWWRWCLVLLIFIIAEVIFMALFSTDWRKWLEGDLLIPMLTAPFILWGVLLCIGIHDRERKQRTYESLAVHREVASIKWQAWAKHALPLQAALAWLPAKLSVAALPEEPRPFHKDRALRLALDKAGKASAESDELNELARRYRMVWQSLFQRLKPVWCGPNKPAKLSIYHLRPENAHASCDMQFDLAWATANSPVKTSGIQRVNPEQLHLLMDAWFDSRDKVTRIVFAAHLLERFDNTGPSEGALALVFAPATRKSDKPRILRIMRNCVPSLDQDLRTLFTLQDDQTLANHCWAVQLDPNTNNLLSATLSAQAEKISESLQNYENLHDPDLLWGRSGWITPWLALAVAAEIAVRKSERSLLVLGKGNNLALGIIANPT